MVEVRPVMIEGLTLPPESTLSPGATAQPGGPAAQAVQAGRLVPPLGTSTTEKRR